jgi:sigma-54 specific flagellar transcriptional regulator A
MPPLRERLEDLPVLIDHLVQRQGQISGRHIRLDKEALSCLARNRWPGNVRELSNLLERLAILFPERTIAAEDLPERYRIAHTPGWTGGGVVLVPAMESRAVESVLDARPGASEMDTVRRDTVRRDTVSDEFADELLAGDEAALPRGGIDLKDHLSAIEIGLIRKALEEADGTVAGAARLLNIRRTTLVEKLRKYRLSA